MMEFGDILLEKVLDKFLKISHKTKSDFNFCLMRFMGPVAG